MKRIIFLPFLLLIFSASINAQSKDEKTFKFNVGLMFGIPTNDYSNLAYGSDIMGEYAVSSSFAITLSAGYIDWANKINTPDNRGLIPVLVGGKYGLTQKWYGSAQAGISFGTTGGTGGMFVYAPGIGYRISQKLDLLLKYQPARKNGFNMSILGLRAGITL